MPEPIVNSAQPTDAAVQTGDFTPAQLHIIAADMVQAGKLTQEQANAELAAAGAPLPAAPAAPLSAAAAEIDAAYPPARPQDFKAPYFGDEFTPEIQQRDVYIRGVLAEARLPAGIGNAVYAEIARFEKLTASMTPAERELQKRSEEFKFDRLHGPRAGVMKLAARRLVRDLEAKRPGLVALLEQSGAGNSVAIGSYLAQHSERLAKRNGQ